MIPFIGPPTPDLFRRQVGRFGERHYIDPLPADDTWPALDPDAEPWPSVTTVKKAWPFYAAKTWAAETVAEWAYDNVNSWRNFDRPTAVKLLKDQAEHSLNRAGKRGTEVHEILDALAAGREQILVDPDAELYLDACRLVIADLKPRWIASETVALSRSMGYGGTFDAIGIVEIEGLGTCIVDWKSRKPGKNGAYPEEGAQVAAYAACDYMIVAGPDGNAVRAPLPHIDHGLIVSIDPGGYECHVVDLEHATECWKALRNFWQAQRKSPMTLIRVGQVVGGGELAPVAAVEQAPPADPQRRQAVIDRIKGLGEVEMGELAQRWPVGVPTFKQSDAHTDEQLGAIEAAVHAVDWSEPDPEVVAGGKVGASVSMPAGDSHLVDDAPAPPWQPPDEGAQLDDETVEAFKATIAGLDKVILTQVNEWAQEAHAAKRPFSLSRDGDRTQRRFEIMRASIALSPYPPDVVRAAISFVMGEEVQPAVTIGAALGSLTIEEAGRLAALAESLGVTTSIVYELNGPTFRAVA